MSVGTALSVQLIGPERGRIPDLRELWRYRELLTFLVWRDVLVRYKQTALGILWALAQPLLTTLVLTVVFGRLARFDSGGAPYPLVTLVAFLPWQFFSQALAVGGNSVVAQSHLITKVYFPRLLVPLSAVVAGLVDFLVGAVVLLGAGVAYATTGAAVAFHWQLMLVPVAILLTIVTALAFTLWLSALNVLYRDVKHAITFLLAIGLYVTPVGFLSSVIPDRWRLWYHLNPMVGVIDAFRWIVLGPAFEPYWPGMGLSILVASALLVTGVAFFRRTEQYFADVI